MSDKRLPAIGGMTFEEIKQSDDHCGRGSVRLANMSILTYTQIDGQAA